MFIPAPIVIFVRPQAQGNVGAISRVMSNFGITELRLVNRPPANADLLETRYGDVDWILACKGKSILDKAQIFKSLPEALHDCELAISTSGRPRGNEDGYSRTTLKMQDALDSLSQWMEQKKSNDLRWALVIGPEDDGLREDEIALCRHLVYIPTTQENPAMNAAMATGCLLYHWHNYSEFFSKNNISQKNRGPFPESKEYSESGRKDWATQEQALAFADYLMETVELTSFLKYPDQAAVLARLQRWVQVAPIPLGELLFAFEILYQIRAKITGEYSKRDFLKKT